MRTAEGVTGFIGVARKEKRGVKADFKSPDESGTGNTWW